MFFLNMMKYPMFFPTLSTLTWDTVLTPSATYAPLCPFMPLYFVQVELCNGQEGVATELLQSVTTREDLPPRSWKGYRAQLSISPTIANILVIEYTSLQSQQVLFSEMSIILLDHIDFSSSSSSDPTPSEPPGNVVILLYILFLSIKSVKPIIVIFNFHDWFIIILHHQDSQQTDRACVKCPSSVAGAVIGPEGEYWPLISRDAEPAPLSCHQVSFSDIRTVRNKRYLY